MCGVKVGGGNAPVGWVGLACSDVCWDGISGEGVDSDMAGCPLHSIDATTALVEACAGGRLGTDDTASNIATETTVVALLVGSAGLESSGGLECALVARVEGRVDLVGIIVGLEDINLAVCALFV